MAKGKNWYMYYYNRYRLKYRQSPAAARRNARIKMARNKAKYLRKVNMKV